MTLSTKPDARTALQELLGEIGQRQMYIPTAVLLRCRAALSAPSEEGIPREPTDAMVVAGITAAMGHKPGEEGAAVEIYQAMWDAAHAT